MQYRVLEMNWLREDRMRIGNFLCRLGFHSWSLPYPHAGDESWCGGAGHHRCHCTREGCRWVRRWYPGEFPNHLKTMENPRE